MFFTWTLTVSSVRPIRSAICMFVRPVAMSVVTSDLARRERDARRVLGEFRRNRRRNPAPSRHDGSDDFEDLGGEHVLHQVPHRAGLKRAVNVLVARVRRQHDDTRGGEFFENRARRLKTVHHRHAQVHEHDIRLNLTVFLERLLAVRCFRDDLELRLGREERGDSAPE